MPDLSPLTPLWFKFIRGDLSQREISEKAGVSRQTWHSWETGKATPSGKRLASLMQLAPAQAHIPVAAADQAVADADRAARTLAKAEVDLLSPAHVRSLLARLIAARLITEREERERKGVP